MEPQAWYILSGVIGIIITIIGSAIKGSQYLNKSFGDVKDLITTKVDSVLAKLEYHEQHDDKRFAEINNGMWELRLQMLQSQLDKKLDKKEDSHST